MRFLVRILLAFALVLGAGQGLSLPADTPACGCCDTPAEPCPCGPTTPVPGHRAPCAAPVQAAAPAQEAETTGEAAPREREAAPWTAAPGTAQDLREATPRRAPRGRDPDLGRHLATLRLLRI
ncbi:MAG: hypothetical protein U0P81_03450 [Holophagaceae bacterium]